MDYADFRHLTFESRPNGVLVVTINRPEVLNAANARLHWEFTQIWPVVDADPKTRVVVVTGAGKAFSAGGDLSLVEDMAGNPDALTRTMREASDLVYNMINLDKPVVSAINGVAVGAGLVVALMADVSITPRPRASPTATRGSAWRRAIMRRFSGRSSAGWRRPSTICSPPTSSTGARRNASDW